MSNITLTGPQACAECGTRCTAETAQSGDSARYAITVRGHRIGIPGLAICTPCAGAIMVGEKLPTVTLEAARDFLDEIWGPQMMMAVLVGPDELGDLAASKLAEAAELSVLLEALIILRDEPGGLDFIPECDGHSHDEQADPRSVAHLN